MLYILPCADEETGKALADAIFGDGNISDGALLLFEDNTPIGLAEIGVGDGFVEIKRIGILPEKRGNGAGDFFARVTIYKLSAYRLPIRLNFSKEYFKQFGFKEESGTMSAQCEQIVFPSCCDKKL